MPRRVQKKPALLKAPSKQELAALREKLLNLPPEQREAILTEPVEQVVPEPDPTMRTQTLRSPALDPLWARAALANFGAQIAQMVPTLRDFAAGGDGTNLGAAAAKAHQAADALSRALIAAQGETFR